MDPSIPSQKTFHIYLRPRPTPATAMAKPKVATVTEEATMHSTKEASIITAIKVRSVSKGEAPSRRVAFCNGRPVLRKRRLLKRRRALKKGCPQRKTPKIKNQRTNPGPAHLLPKRGYLFDDRHGNTRDDDSWGSIPTEALVKGSRVMMEF